MKSPLLFGLLLTLNISSIALTLTTPTTVLAETPQQQAERHNVRGGELFQANDARNAISEFDRAIAIEPNNPQFYFNRGYVKWKGLDDLAGALADFDRTIELKPSFTEAYAARAGLKEKMGNYSWALKDYDKAIANSPKSWRLLQERGILRHVRLKQLYAAVMDFDKAIELAPNDAMNYAFRGFAYRDMRNMKRFARMSFEKCLELAQSQNNRELVNLMRENLRKLGN
jgi:tetratricopeptide (TPR) repeat protein